MHAALPWFRFRHLALAGLLAGQLHAADETSLSFAAAWQQLRDVNPALAAARTEVGRRGEEQQATRSLFGPQIELNSRHTVIDSPITIDLSPIRQAMLALHPGVPPAAIPPFIQPVQDERFWRAQLTATWPLYTGGRIRAAQSAARAGVTEAESEARRLQDSLFGELVRRFYGAQLARVVRGMRADVLAGLEEHLRQAEKLEAEGFIARAERLHAQVARDEAWRELRQAETQVAVAEAALAGLFGRETPLAPASALFIAAQPLGSLEGYVAAAVEHHPALAVAAAKRDQAEAGITAEKGRLQPEVYLFGAKELNRGDLTILDPDWAAGVGVRVVLFERTDRTHRLAAARLLSRRINQLTDDLRHNLRTLVTKAHREAALAQEQYGSFATTLDLARENLRVREAAFREGLGTSLDVVDARLALARAETARAASARDYVVALATLLEASGQPEQFLALEAGATERISP